MIRLSWCVSTRTLGHCCKHHRIHISAIPFLCPEDGIYTFNLLSDDGSTLKINGELVVDNDGPHSPREVTGQKALAKGLHPIEVKYFDHNGGMLQLKVLTADGKELPVNADMFAY